MSHGNDSHPSNIAFSDAVKAAQTEHGSRAAYARMGDGAGWDTDITPARAEYIAASDSFYMATASADGRPYIQHRGGPVGFLKVLDDKRLAFADFAGNRQYISVGNLAENDRVCLFLMDYPGRARLKIWGRATTTTDPAILAQVTDTEYGARIERAMIITVEVMDGNCSQHIAQRFTQTETDIKLSR